jgi:hypothetical protein
MKKLMKSTRALGTPVANLIVLTAAVLLTTTVTLFAVNVTSSQVQKENMYITRTHLWYLNSNQSIGAVVAINTGATDIVLNKIAVKGLECAWNGTYNFIVYNKTDQVPSDDLPFVSNFTTSGPNTVPIGNEDYIFEVAGEDLTLKSGWTMMFYIVIPERLMVYDLGLPVRMVISTTQSAYCTEILVQTAT